MIVTLHLIAITATLLVVAYSDEQALVWALGRKKVLSPRVVEVLHMLVSIGLGLVIITGGLLYIQAPQAYLSDTTFLIKMVAVAALIVNTYFIGRFAPTATSRTYASLTNAERIPLFISGAVSLLGWGTALLCGYLLG